MQKIRIRFAYRAGFRRLWAVLSVIWIVIGAYFLIADNLSWSKFFQFIVLPVIIVYALGVLVVWVIEGFARADK